MKTITRKKIETAVNKMDPNLKKSDELGFMAAAVLLASAFVGADAVRIQKFLKYPAEIIGMFDAALRKNRVWMGEKICADWTGENGGAEFWLCVLVATGHMTRK